MEQKNAQPKKYLYALLIGIGSGISLIFTPALFVVAGFLGAVGAMWGVGALLLSVGASVAVSGLIFGVESLSIVAVYAPAALAVGLMLYKRRPYRYAAATAAALNTLGMYALLCLPGILDGSGPYTAIQDSVSMMKDVFVQAGTLAGTEEQIKLFSQLLDRLIAMIPDTLLASIVSIAMASAGLAVLIAHGIAKKRSQTLLPMAQIADWRLGRSFFIGACVLLAGSLVVLLIEMNGGYAVMLCAQVIAGLPIMLQGIALIEYLGRRKQRLAAYRAAWICGGLLLMPFSVYVFSVLGIADQVIRLRARIDEQNK